MNATRFSRIFATLALILSLASPVFAFDATQAARRDITPKSPVPTGTVATWPMDAAVPPGWLACNGQAVPATYSELRALMPSVPNYNNRQFLRGSTSGAGSSVADSTRSHTHGQPSHSHGFSLTAAGQSVSGTAAGQRYLDTHTGVSAGYPGSSAGASLTSNFRYVNNVIGEGVISGMGESFLYTWLDTRYTRTAESSRVTASGSASSVSGNIYQSGGDETYATGSSETAPTHTLVKYIIKAD